MNRKVLLIGSLAIIILALGVVYGPRLWKQEVSNALIGKNLIYGADLTSAKKIVLEAGGATLTWADRGPYWELESSKINYPAEEGALRNLINQLETAHFERLVTRDADKLADLGLSTQDFPDRLSVFNSNDELLYRITMGKERGGETTSGFGGQYVLFDGGAYLISKVIEYQNDAYEWIRSHPLDFDLSEAQSVAIIHGADEQIFERETPEDSWSFNKITDEEELSQTEVDILVEEIAQIEVFVRDADTKFPTNPDDKITIEVRLFSGINYKIAISKGQDDESLMQVDFSVPPQNDQTIVVVLENLFTDKVFEIEAEALENILLANDHFIN